LARCVAERAGTPARGKRGEADEKP